MGSIRSQHVESSSSFEEARALFLQDLRSWVDACLLDLGHTTIDNHDQATVCTSWEVLVKAGFGGGVVTWLSGHRDAIKGHHERAGLWHHGYWKEQEAHHGTEHFELFLASLWRMDPADAETVRQFVDAVEHVGNWADGVPEWFNWEHGVFRSMFLGTERVGEGPALGINIPDHLRCVNLCLQANEMTGASPYLDLAVAHGGRWADAVTGSDTLPVGLDATGGGIYGFDRDAEAAYRGFAGMIQTDLDQLGRAENFLASNGVQTFLDLYRLTGDARFLSTAEAILDALVPCLTDPDAGCVVAALWGHFRQTGSDRYLSVLRDALDPMGAVCVDNVGIDPFVSRETQPVGAGKRRDMPAWFHDGRPRGTSPVHLAHLAMMRGDAEDARLALDLARAMFRLALQVYPHGRHHGCSARTVSAIARGHGRDNNVGVVTGVLGPLLDFVPRADAG